MRPKSRHFVLMFSRMGARPGALAPIYETLQGRRVSGIPKATGPAGVSLRSTAFVYWSGHASSLSPPLTGLSESTLLQQHNTWFYLCTHLRSSSGNLTGTRSFIHSFGHSERYLSRAKEVSDLDGDQTDRNPVLIKSHASESPCPPCRA